MLRHDEHGRHAERVRHGEVAREVLEHRGLPGVDAVHRQKSIVGLRRRLGLELGRDDVEYIIEMVRQTKPPQHSGNVAACAVGEDEFAAGKLFNRGAKRRIGLQR